MADEFLESSRRKLGVRILTEMHWTFHVLSIDGCSHVAVHVSGSQGEAQEGNLED